MYSWEREFRLSFIVLIASLSKKRGSPSTSQSMLEELNQRQALQCLPVLEQLAWGGLKGYIYRTPN